MVNNLQILTKQNQKIANYKIHFVAKNIKANARKLRRSEFKMANKNVVPEAREALNRFKMEAASEVGVPEPSLN